jgi:hypothetical protein
MTTVFINDMSQSGVHLLEQIKLYPDVAQIVNTLDQSPLPVPEEELVSLEEFKMHMEELAQSQLGLNLKL